MRVSPGPLLLDAAVEEVRHVRVLLRLGGVQLPRAVPGRAPRRASRRRRCSRERDRAVEVVAVARHRRQVEAGVEQPLRELAAAVRAEVEEDRGVAARRAAAGPSSDDRLDELVGDARARSSPARRRPGRLRGAPRRATIAAKRALGALPALVAVHRVVAADDGRDPLGGQLREVVARPRAARRRGRR